MLPTGQVNHWEDAVRGSEARGEPVRTTGKPAVSILIPVHNGLDFTRPCLESLFATAVESVPFEVIFIDDQSTDGTDEYFHSLGSRIRVLQNDTRKSFAEKINLAAPVASGEYLCLLNNDTLVSPGWLQELLAVARQDPGIAVVGNRHLTPETGLINHAGMVFNANGNPTHLYRGQAADFWPALISQDFQILTAACWLVSKQKFLELGGFDPAFRNGFEDVDFCLRARRKGYRIFYNAESVIYHHGLSTPGRKDHEEANSEYFKSKWGAAIVPDMNEFYVIPSLPPEPEPPDDNPATPLPETPLQTRPSHIEERYAHIERLHARHPLIASLLRAMVRLATSIAKYLNR